MKRLLIEILVFALLAAGGWGAYKWSEYRFEQRQAAEDESMGLLMAENRLKVDETIAQVEVGEAAAAGRAFAAGVEALVLGGQHDAVDAALGALLRIPEVVFVHVLDDGGGVIATSDRKLLATGRAGSRAAWALAAREVTTRAAADTTEVAVPFGDDTVAVLWLAWDKSSAGGVREVEPLAMKAEESTPES